MGVHDKIWEATYLRYGSSVPHLKAESNINGLSPELFEKDS